jgi:hypothetical protein
MEPNLPSALTDISVIDRWRKWFGVSMGIHFGTFIFYPMLICGCHFHLIALVVSSGPMVWGGYTLLNYQAAGERITAYLNTALTLGWLYLAWESNLRFAF